MKQQTPTKQIPKGWKKEKIGKVCLVTDYVANGSFASLRENVKYNYKEDFAILLRLADYSRSFNGPFVYINEHAYNYLLKSKLIIGDVVLSNVGSVGSLFKVPDLKKPMSLAPNTVLIRTLNKELVMQDFLFYFLQSPIGQSLINKITTGTTQRKFNKTNFRDLEISIPLLLEQTLIVSEIEKQFTRLDAAVKSLKDVKGKLEVYRKAVLKKAFEKKEDWEEKKISELCEIISGSTPKTSVQEYWGGDINWITPKDLSGYKNKYINKTERTITQKGYDSCPTILIPENNVLMSSRAPIGYLAINKVPMCTNQGFKSFRIIDRKKLNEEFLYYYLKFIVEIIKKQGSGTTFNEISKGKAESINLLLPNSLSEQTQIVQEIESKFSVIDKIEQAVNDALKKAERLRKSILKSAFEGKLVKMEYENGS